jgi:hypothetical protein
MPTQVRGLLLITANGHKYFIEGGILADQDDSIQISGDSPGSDRSVTFQPIANATIKQFQDAQRQDWFDNHPAVSPSDNLGPFIMQAYSVFRTREDDGNDSEVTGNGSEIPSPD